MEADKSKIRQRIYEMPYLEFELDKLLILLKK